MQALPRSEQGHDDDHAARATWRGAVLAESRHVVCIDGTHYFPPDALARRYLRPSRHTTLCPRRGIAHYFDVVVGDAVNRNAAWTYADPPADEAMVRDRIAFWKGVAVSR